MEKDWLWMPHAGHLCVSDRCKFHLNTYVNGYIISTVGEYKSQIESESEEFDDIGANRKYETMVFKAKKSDVGCCPYEAIIEGESLEFEGYNDPLEARIGHIELCKKYDK
jgi:hypothetical protein